MDIPVPPHITGADGGGKSGIFGFMHYNVRGGGPNEDVRHHHLGRIYEANFIVGPDAGNGDYVREFGEPKSVERFDKMERFLDSQIQRYGNRAGAAWQECIDKWEADVEWLVDTFGAEHGVIWG